MAGGNNTEGRPAGVWILAVGTWLVTGYSNILTDPGGHSTTTEEYWQLSTALTGAGIIIASIVFIRGYGWARVALGILFSLNAAWPGLWILQDQQYWLSHPGWPTPEQSVEWSAALPPLVPAAIIVILMYAVPSVRKWFRKTREWRKGSNNLHIPPHDAPGGASGGRWYGTADHGPRHFPGA